MHEPRLGRPEATPAIETSQVRLEVYVKLLDTTVSGYLYRLPHQLPSNTAAT